MLLEPLSKNIYKVNKECFYLTSRDTKEAQKVLQVWHQSKPHASLDAENHCSELINILNKVYLLLTVSRNNFA